MGVLTFAMRQLRERILIDVVSSCGYVQPRSHEKVLKLPLNRPPVIGYQLLEEL